MRAFRGGLVAAGLLASSLLACCKQEKATIPTVVYQGPLLETENVVTLLSDSARLQIRLTAPLEQRFESNDLLYPKGVIVTFYNKPGTEVVNTLQANWGKYDATKQLYIMRGDVRVLNVPQQQRLFTEEAFYNRAQQKIYTDSSMLVRVKTPGDSIVGYGLTANQDFSRYSILRPVGKTKGL
ncbi:MAG: LPS export ABC transporter periplasmic protein LptC [Janthinobacterium lividum]